MTLYIVWTTEKYTILTRAKQMDYPWLYQTIAIFSNSKSALENRHRDIGKLAESKNGLLTSYDIQITLDGMSMQTTWLN